LGSGVAELTVARYMFRGRTPPSQEWLVFLKNHARKITAIGFFTLPTVNFRILICFVVLWHHRRTVVRFKSRAAGSFTIERLVGFWPAPVGALALSLNRSALVLDSPVDAALVAGCFIGQHSEQRPARFAAPWLAGESDGQ